MSGGRLTQRNGWLWCALAAVFFGAATPATKSLVDDVGAVTLAGLLYLGAGIAVAPFTVREQPSGATAGQRSRLMLPVMVGGGLAPVLLVLALDRTPAATVSLLLNLELVATALIARVFLREHIGRRAALGIAVVVAAGVAHRRVRVRVVDHALDHRRPPGRRGAGPGDLCVGTVCGCVAGMADQRRGAHSDARRGVRDVTDRRTDRGLGASPASAHA